MGILPSSKRLRTDGESLRELRVFGDTSILEGSSGAIEWETIPEDFEDIRATNSGARAYSTARDKLSFLLEVRKKYGSSRRRHIALVRDFITTDPKSTAVPQTTDSSAIASLVCFGHRDCINFKIIRSGRGGHRKMAQHSRSAEKSSGIRGSRRPSPR